MIIINNFIFTIFSEDGYLKHKISSECEGDNNQTKGMETTISSEYI